jgi:hypothetical protein
MLVSMHAGVSFAALVTTGDGARGTSGRHQAASVTAANCVDANIAATAAIILGPDAPAWLERLGLPARLVVPGRPRFVSGRRRPSVRLSRPVLGRPGGLQRPAGTPRLRMRHGGFRIGTAERDAWYGHMADAVAARGLEADDEAEMLAYFDVAATHLINAG